MGKSVTVLFATACLVLSACGSGDVPDPTSGSDQAFLERTAKAHESDSTVPSPLAQAAPDQEVVSRMLAYGEADERNLMGYLSMPADATQPLPGLIVIHEWWGLNDNIRAATDRLAAEGYVALAIDLYGGQVAETAAAAETLMAELMASRSAGGENIRQAHQYLSKYAQSPRVGAIGWCLGGGWSLNSALLLSGELDAAVMYYGRVSTDEDALTLLETPLLGLFAGQDRVIQVADVETFRATLQRLGKDATIHIYPQADHAFANPTGGAYDAAAATDAWTKTLEFLRAHLGGPEV